MAKASGRIEVASVADRVYSALREQILAGDLEPESRLHQEGISAGLGVSRTPVREALARLAADGLVELLPQRGARVAAIHAHAMEAAYVARLGFEPLAARLAAQRADGRPLRRALSAKGYRASRAFHLALVSSSGNPFLIDFANAVWAGRIGMHVYARQMTDDQLALDAAEHEAIIEAIEAGDEDTAERLTREHIEHALDVLLGRVDETGHALSERRAFIP